jgi:hypothetical protein
MILKRNAPRKYLRQLETSKLTTAEWKNLIIDARTHVEDSGREDDEEEDDDDDDEDEADDGSLPSGFDKGQYDEEDLQTGDIFEVDWDDSQMGERGDWVPSMKSHHAAIDLLGSILNSSMPGLCQGSECTSGLGESRRRRNTQTSEASTANGP